MGRSQKPYRTSWGETVDGLYRRSDGCWKIIASGELFTCKDEYTAVAKFKQRSPNHATVFVPAKPQPQPPILGNEGWKGVNADASPADTLSEHGQTGHLLDETAVWEMVRKVIIETPDLAAQKLRIPQIASLKSLALPLDPTPVSTIIDVYKTKNPATKKPNGKTLNRFTISSPLPKRLPLTI